MLVLYNDGTERIRIGKDIVLYPWKSGKSQWNIGIF